MAVSGNINDKLNICDWMYICKYYNLCSIVACGDCRLFLVHVNSNIWFLSDLILNCFDDYISVHDMQNIRDQVWDSVCDKVFDDEVVKHNLEEEEEDGMQR